MLGIHLILRLGDDRVIAPSRAARRRLARKLAELSRCLPVLAWKVADTHMHVIVLGEAAADEVIRRLRMWFTRVAQVGVPLEVQRRKPIVSQSHLEAATRYALTQDAHHGVLTDAWQDASSLPDTLGLRPLCPEIAVRVREHLPRLPRAALLGWLGAPTLDEAVSAEHLLDAATAAFAVDGLEPHAAGADARRAAVAAASTLGTGELARILGVTPRAVRRLAADGAPPRWTRAVRLQMGFRAVQHTALAHPPALAHSFSPAALVIEEAPLPTYTAWRPGREVHAA